LGEKEKLVIAIEQQFPIHRSYKDLIKIPCVQVENVVN